jgi:nitrate reductase delta subunit
MIDARLRQLCSDLGKLLSYPRSDTPSLARHALGIAGVGNPGAASLARFVGRAEALGASALEELYTATFDLAPVCAPYLGAHLLGEDNPLRGRFLAKLAELYAEDGFRAREELPDHLSEVLAFLALARPGAARDDLLRDGLLPTLDRMIAAIEDASNPYRELLVATRTLLELPHPSPLPRTAGERDRERGLAPGAAEPLAPEVRR